MQCEYIDKHKVNSPTLGNRKSLVFKTIYLYINLIMVNCFNYIPVTSALLLDNFSLPVHRKTHRTTS